MTQDTKRPEQQQQKQEPMQKHDGENLLDIVIEAMPDIGPGEDLAQNPLSVDAFMPQIPDVIESPEDAKEAQEAISAMDVQELKDELKKQILSELKDEQVKKMELEKERRERETEEQQNYIAKMKQSPDPWVDIIGWVKDKDGVRTELEWNDAFVDYLRTEGVTGVDDDAVVQKWVVVLMHDMANRMDDEGKETTDSEFAG